MAKVKRQINERDFKIILPVASQGMIDHAAVRMSNHFGGVTMQPLIRGLWLDQKSKLVKDDNVLLFSSRDLDDKKDKRKTLDSDRKFMKSLASEYAKRLKQDSIWIEEDIVKDVQFVKPTKRRLKRIV